MTLPILQTLPPRRRKLVLWAVGLFVAYTIIGFFILPPIIRAVAAKQISKQLDRDVAIQKVRLNPFVFSTTIRGLVIKDRDGEPFVSWDEVYVNFQLSSFLGRPWVFREIRTAKPFLRVQMNKDYTFNFSDIVTKFSTNVTTEPKVPSKPLAVRVDKLSIQGASASLTDLTPRTPFKRIVGPLDVTLENFRTDPSNRNPYSFTGTTDAGEEFSWSGHFYLDPIRSEGEFSLRNLTLHKYAPLYQDFVRFQIRNGVVDVGSAYRFELSASNKVAIATNSSFRLRSFELAEAGSDVNLAELPDFSVTGASLDAIGRRAEVRAIAGTGGKLTIRRDKQSAINLVELSKPAADGTNATSGGIMFLLQSVTNAVAMLLDSTNQWAATIHLVNVTNCALKLEDLANARPVHLQLDDISVSAKHISNLPGSNLTAAVSLRWNTNGVIRTAMEASFVPPTADIQIALEKLELRALDPYLEPKLNVFLLDSKLSMNGDLRLRTRDNSLPDVTFAGDVRLDDFAAVDGAFAEDLLKWGSVRISGIDANLNPPTVAIREIAADDVYARLVIETNRTINLMTALRMEQTNAPQAAPGPQPAAKAKTKGLAAAEASIAAATNMLSELPKISVAAVVVSNAQVRFTDRSMVPGVNMTIAHAGGTITGLSSFEMQRADVNLHASVDNVGPVEITGGINPFRQDVTNTIRISVKNVDLTPASPYVGRFAGYRLAKGKLGMDLDYSIRGRELKSGNIIVLDQFTFGEKVDSPDATKLPVRLAIAILKDRHGKIQLDVPIEGSLDDPELKLNKVIVRTILNVLTKVATSPFSMLGAVFGGGGEELSYQDFTPGRAELQQANRGKLDSLLKGLYERPALQLDIEGSVDPEADLEGLRRAAVEKRMRTVKWMSLSRTEQAATRPEQITLAPQEREELLRRVFAEALAKGELAMVLSRTNQSGPASNAVPAVSLTAARALAGIGASGEKGAATLMRLGSESAAPATSGTAATKSSAEQTMEQLLAAAMTVGDSDFQALAAARARAVREYLVASGQVEPERIFLVEQQPGGVKTAGAKAYLQLK